MGVSVVKTATNNFSIVWQFDFSNDFSIINREYNANEHNLEMK